MVSSPLTALKPQLPSLTPSLAKLYRESLIGHVTGWPAEAVEKACQRINDEHQNLSNLCITRVSAELKMARCQCYITVFFSSVTNKGGRKPTHPTYANICINAFSVVP
jgi:hypothetical protein